MTHLDKHVEFLELDMYADWRDDKRTILEFEKQGALLQKAHQAVGSAMQLECPVSSYTQRKEGRKKEREKERKKRK